MNRFSDFIELMGSSKDIEPLPLIHTTTAYSLREIIDNNWTINPTYDNIFSEELTYFFYGKSGYIRQTEKFMSLGHGYPVTFIVNSESMRASRRIFPFDSGAFEAGLFANYFSPEMKLSDFSVDLDISHSGGVSFSKTAMKLVNTFYFNNYNYFINSPQIQLSRINAMEFETRAYLSLISGNQETAYDERASIVEIQSSKPVELKGDSLIGIIAPITLMSDPKFSEKIMEFGTKVYTYNPLRSKPEYYASLTTDKIGDFLIANKLMNPKYA